MECGVWSVECGVWDVWEENLERSSNPTLFTIHYPLSTIHYSLSPIPYSLLKLLTDIDRANFAAFSFDGDFAFGYS